MSYQPVKAVSVQLWGRQVGALAQDPASGYFAFEYDSDWLASGISLSPLHLPARKGVFVFPNLPANTYHRLPAALADALPDEFGNQIVNAWLATKGVAASRITPLDRLSYMANRAMGALEFRPHRNTPHPPSIIEASDLVASARALMDGSFASDHESQVALRQLLHVGTSAGGQRAKAVIAFNPDTRGLRASTLPLSAGYSHWLLKLDGVAPSSKDGAIEPGATQGYGRVEYAYHLMARAAGIDMTRCQLLEENGRAHFLTERFDRRGEEKTHVQTLCAMAHMDYKQIATHDYAQLFQTALTLGLSGLEVSQLFRRLCFNTMAMNCDDHTKNFAFLMDHTGRWSLSPAYDLTFAYSPHSHWVSQHLMGVDGKFFGVSDIELLTFASRYRIDDAPGIVLDVRRAVSRWLDFADQAGMETGRRDEIASHITPRRFLGPRP